MKPWQANALAFAVAAAVFVFALVWKPLIILAGIIAALSDAAGDNVGQNGDGRGQGSLCAHDPPARENCPLS
jgi:hypothetical protein